LILPEFNRQEVEGLLLALLGHHEQNYVNNIMCEWPEDIDTIIDNLKPEKKNSKKR
jgi:hypothetical protein